MPITISTEHQIHYPEQTGTEDITRFHTKEIRLNEDERFYMRSRGIPEEEAKVLQMISFVAPVIAGLDDEILATRIENAICSLVGNNNV